MNITLLQSHLAEVESEALVLVVFEDDKSSDRKLEKPVADWLREISTTGEFEGKLGDLALLYRPEGLKAKRLAVVGGGAKDKFTPAEMRKAAGSATRSLKGKSLRDLTFTLEGSLAEAPHVEALVEGVLLGDYEPDQLKTDEKKSDKRLTSVTIAIPKKNAKLEAAIERGRIMGEAANIARDLQNEPSNLLTPLVLAERAKRISSAAGLECEVLDEAKMREIGMGSLLGVAQGSDNPPALIVIRYTPEKPSSSDHLALVGKGVTFDSGGISIKPAEGMEKMRYDMSGGAAAIAAMHALAQLKPSVRVTAYIPAVENMINGKAQRPGDIVKSLNGKTIEVLNTDAEGRLILVDAFTYAIRQGCTHIVDAATLTGAIVVALGFLHIGAFSNNDALMAQVEQAGKEAGESMWRMPLDDDYKEYLKSAFADLPNIGGRWGGSITAAKFLEAFVEDKPWVHLDIAGTAWLDDAKPWMAKGPAGLPARTFIKLAMNWKS